MSRSRRFPSYKLRGHIGKTLANRTHRRVNRQRINDGLEPLNMRELINDWDICDYTYSPSWLKPSILNERFIQVLSRK